MATTSVSIIPECSICFEDIKTPKVLPCGHSFCLCCIERYIGDKKRTFLCPICKQDVKIPKGGAEKFITNYIVQTSKHTGTDHTPSTRQPKCPNHKQREVDYYCNNCNVGLCLKCIFKQHKDHETLDIECDETRNEAIEKLQSSQNIIQDRIRNLEKTRSTLLESFEQLKIVCEDSCAKVTKKTEKIISELRKNCEQIIKDIKKNLEENRIKVEDRDKEITSDINVLESNMESNISPSTETTLNILQTLHRFIEIEKMSDSRQDYELCIPYLQWVGKDFSLDIDQLGSVISKSFYILVPGSYQFVFNVSDIEKDDTDYNSKNKIRNNDLVWSSCVGRIGDDFYIDIILVTDDNPNLQYCIIDGQLSLLNIDDDSKTISRTVRDMRLKRDDWWRLYNPITWSKLTDKNNAYINSTGQFVVQCDLTKISEISWK